MNCLAVFVKSRRVEIDEAGTDDGVSGGVRGARRGRGARVCDKPAGSPSGSRTPWPRRCHEGLRIAIDQGEPGALDLDHDLVTSPEGVCHVVEAEVHRSGLVGDEWSGGGKTGPELAPHHIAADELLVSAQARTAGARVVSGENVDQLDHPVGIGAGGRDEQASLDRADDCEVLFERSGLVDQNVGTAGGEPLVMNHVIAVHPLGDLIDELHRTGRVTHVLIEGRWIR